MADEDFKVQLELEEREKLLSGEGYSSSHTYTDPNDGTVYEWDYERNAWFPKIDDDFIAAYQANYGCDETAGGTSKPSEPPPNPEPPQPQQQQPAKPAWMIKLEKRKAAESQGWFDVSEEHNTNVYVSGLPPDTTEEEFVELMSKCGIIMKDESQQLKYKLYRDEQGNLKGDARCCYIKVESVKLALQILDESVIKGHKIKVERAKFNMRGQYDPSKKPKRKRPNDKRKQKKVQEKLFDWRPDRPMGSRFRFEKTVIIKNMFDTKEFETDPTLVLEYTSDLREECAKFGQVKKVVVYDRNTDGVASVTFEEAEEADECIKALNGRWFSQRKLEAAHWDGKAKFHVAETEEEKQKRLRQWEDFLVKDKPGEDTEKPASSKENSDSAKRKTEDNPNEVSQPAVDTRQETSTESPDTSTENT